MNLLHASPAAGFDEPFALMAACHERMERTLDLLERLGAHVATHGCDAQATDAAKDVLRYFTIAAPLHHEDEELHVFPRLREQGNGELADRLLADHREMETRWAAIVPDLTAIRDGSMPGGTLAAARERSQTFATLYRRHIDAEDHDAYPAASAATPDPEQRLMGEEMAGRRRG
ncbi:hemerythrin domain-containing protein [Roseateles chitinivorans]|uniref:hemerythrin domain-containing protein n=1 Tax=Roseateles chitinivorans TaxID=2917965 RepID=UPI003D66E6E5